MDCYPEHLAPDFDEWGGVATPFDVWWARAQRFFKNVPEEVAQYWIHEHWGHSNFGHLKSQKYSFEKIIWPLNSLSEIRSIWSDYNNDNEGCRVQGETILRTNSSKSARFTLEHGHPPIPIIVLDNQDGHLANPHLTHFYPKGFILIEGHRRFNICSALNSRNKLISLPVWLMSPNKNAE